VSRAAGPDRSGSARRTVDRPRLPSDRPRPSPCGS
jgi:hypothetical protein